MKVVYINENVKKGSIGRLTNELFQYLNDTGNEAYIFYASGEKKSWNIKRVGTRFNQIIHAFFSRLTGLQGYFSLFPTLVLCYRIGKIKPDIVHLQNLHANYINIKVLFGFLARNDISTVITLHDCWFYTGKCTHYVAAGCDKWKKNCGSCPLLRKDNINPTWIFDRTKKSLLDKRRLLLNIPRLGVTGVSEWIVSEAKNSFLKDCKFVTIYNWVDTNIFYYRKSMIQQKKELEGKKIVLFVASRMEMHKGYAELCYLAKYLTEEYCIVFIGKNNADCPLPPPILHVETINNPIELAEWYSASYICVNTTKYETFGMVTLEAMACGTPVIVYDNTASKEIVKKGYGYCLQEKDGYEKILNTIIYMEEDVHLLARPIRSNKIREQFSKNSLIEKYVSFYKELGRIYNE